MDVMIVYFILATLLLPKAICQLRLALTVLIVFGPSGQKATITFQACPSPINGQHLQDLHPPLLLGIVGTQGRLISTIFMGIAQAP